MSAIRRPAALRDTNTQLNTERLPPPEETRTMALALPHGTLREDLASPWGFTGAALTLGAAFLLVLTALFPTPLQLLILAASGVASGLALRTRALEPSRFYREFALAQRDTHHSERERLQGSLGEEGPSLWTLLLLGGALTLSLAFQHAFFFAPVVSLLVLAGALVRFSPLPPKTWLPFLTYEAKDPYAPGVWVPSTDALQGTGEALVARRRRTAFWLWHALLPLLAVGAAAPLLLPLERALRSLLSSPLFSWPLAGAMLAALTHTLTTRASAALFARSATADEAFSKTLKKAEPEPEALLLPEWKESVLRLQSSSHVAQTSEGPVSERDHVLLGCEPSRRFPLLVHRGLFKNHFHVLGATGAGKTSLALLPVLLQLMGVDKRVRPAGDPAIVIIDLKGDPALFHAVRLHCASINKRFQFFTPEPGVASHYFDPLQGFVESSASIPQLAQMLLDSLSLNHGEGYGRSYFTRVARAALLEVLKQKPRPATFDEMLKGLQRLAKTNSAEFRDTQELIAVLRALTHYPQIVLDGTNPPPAERIIRMGDVLRERSCAYFWLPAGRESASVREIGKLVLFNLYTALERFAPGEVEAFLMIDEFQRLVGENLNVILEQARSKGLGVILSNHTYDQLRTADCDIGPVLKGVVHSGLYFRSRDLREIKDLSQLSGLDLESDPWWTTPEHDRRGPTTRPRLTIEDLQWVRDLPGGFAFHPSAGRGYTQYGGLLVPGQGSHVMPFAVYQRLERMPWPSEPRIASPRAQKQPKEIDFEAWHEVNTMAKELFESTPGSPTKTREKKRASKAPKKQSSEEDPDANGGRKVERAVKDVLESVRLHQHLRDHAHQNPKREGAPED